MYLMYSLILILSCSPVSCPDSLNNFPPSQLNNVLSSLSPSLPLDHVVFLPPQIMFRTSPPSLPTCSNILSLSHSIFS